MSQSTKWFEEKQAKEIEEEAIQWNKNHILTCPKCGGKHIRIKAGMMCDLYTCNDCNWERR